MSVKKVIILSCIAFFAGAALSNAAYRLGYWYNESKTKPPVRLVKPGFLSGGAESEPQ